MSDQVTTMDLKPNNGISSVFKKSDRDKLHDPTRLALLRFFANKPAVFGLILFVLLGLVVIAAPILATDDPEKMDYDAILVAPNTRHIMGTDDMGRDIFSRVIWGGRESLRVGFMAVLIALSGGVFFGVLTGYIGGWVDMITQRLVEIILAFPAILLLLSIVAALGPSLMTVLIAIGMADIPTYLRMVRGSVLGGKNAEYITAARVVGAKDMRIMFRHLLPNIVGPILVYGTLGLGSAIMLTAGLSYIGLGAQPPSPEWGAMLNYGRSYLDQAWWMSLFPGLMVFLAVLSINLFGDGLRDALDPKTRK